MSTTDGVFTLNDLRGEYWLYSEGELRVNVGQGGIRGVSHFNTSDIHLQSGGPIDSKKVAEILSKLMIQVGDRRGGYRHLVLHNDGKYILSREDVALIDQRLSEIGFQLTDASTGDEVHWKRTK
jgi:hypothetical protein